MSMPPFHLAFPVTDLDATHGFYVNVLGAKVGRAAKRWIDFDFWGHQLSAHLVSELASVATNPVDGKQVPARHFGLVLPWEQWHVLEKRLKEAEVSFLIEPHIRFPGEIGEQATMFLADPSGNALEFKSFRDAEQLFAR